MKDNGDFKEQSWGFIRRNKDIMGRIYMDLPGYKIPQRFNIAKRPAAGRFDHQIVMYLAEGFGFIRSEIGKDGRYGWEGKSVRWTVEPSCMQ
jgi:hypothetical protein